MIANPQALLDQIRDEVTRRRLELESLDQQSPPSEDGNRAAIAEPPDPLDLRLDLQPIGPTPERIRLRDLLRYYDRRFVEFAFQCILKRPMDAGGEWYVDRLRKGKSRIDALIRIRYGCEGKAKRTPVRGLWIRRVMFTLSQIRVIGSVVRGIGYVLRLLWCLATLPRRHAELEAWKHYTMSQFTKVEDHVNLSTSRMSAAVAELVDDRQLADLKDQLQQELRVVEATVESQVGCLDELVRQSDAELRRMESQIRHLVERVEDVSHQVDGLQSSWSDVDQHSRRLEQLESNRADVAQLTPRVTQLERARTELDEVIRQVGELQSREANLGEYARQFDQLKAIKVDLDVLSRRVDQLDTPRVNHDELYAGLTDRFRGSEEEIRQRQEYYIPIVKAAGAGTAGAPVLDVGSGRGEWLSLLRDHGMEAYGVETNEVFLDRCRRTNLNVERAEALRYLESVGAGAIGAITAFHVIEHLRADEQIRLLQLAFRALRPGGVLILETPNPEHLSVAVLRFHLDPTHVRPVPTVLLEYIAQHAGFQEIRIDRRCPSSDGEAAQGWSRFQDYALIGVRPDDG